MTVADPNPMLRAELVSALAIVEPQVRGLRDFARTSLSAVTLAAVNEQIELRGRRAHLIHRVINALDAVIAAMTELETDGYPVLENTAVFATIYQEIQQERTDLLLAAGVFDTKLMASKINIDLGAIMNKVIT